MIRRRRPVREPVFSFDSFLDLVTNVVGVIIRLILVTWVGARSYHAAMEQLAPSPPQPAEVPAAVAAALDPVQAELARQRAELDQAQARLLEQLKQVDWLKEESGQAERKLADLAGRRLALNATKTSLEKAAAGTNPGRDAALSLAELEERRTKLGEELKALEQSPPPKKTLRYRTPVSQPVASDQWHFECQNGRVTFVNIPDMMADVDRRAPDIAKDLDHLWHVVEVSEAYGEFRMRFQVERLRNGLDAAFGRGGPDPNARSYRWGVTWRRVESVTPVRGESAEAALSAGSDFRRMVDRLDPELATITLWVYPDSFALYRQLRDYLADRGLTVAGRPMPAGVPIGFSPNGSASRGQ
jgi:hypothetical protein